MTAADPLPVTVVIPCHRNEASLAAAVDSVRRQTRPPQRLVLVADAPDPGTSRAVAAVTDCHAAFEILAVTTPEHSGPGSARNLGIAHAAEASDYIAFLDADDRWLPEKLVRQVDWMNRHPHVGWSGCRVTFSAGGTTATSLHAAVPRSRPLTVTNLLWRNTVHTSGVIARRRMPCLFRAGWSHCEDLMLWTDWLANGFSGVLLEELLVVLGRHPLSPGGLSADLPAMHAGESAVLDTLAREGRLSPVAACGWRAWFAFRYRVRRARCRLRPTVPSPTVTTCEFSG